MTKGVINVIATPRKPRAAAPADARRCSPTTASGRASRACRAALRAIKHVIYVIKENRTYDQVLGDLGKGDGDPRLTLFREDSAPNHRELARRFTLFDNFYADADVSADGQSWATSAGVTDYTTRPGRSPTRPSPRKAHARARLREPLDGRAVPDRAARVRRRACSAPPRRRRAATSGTTRTTTASRSATTAMYTTIPGDCTGAGNTSTTTRLDDSRFGDHVNEYFAGFNLSCSDHAHRLPEWEREFRAYEQLFAQDPERDPLPQLSLVRLPERPHERARRPGARRRRPTWPTTTSRSAGWSTSSRTAGSGRARRSS